MIHPLVNLTSVEHIGAKRFKLMCVTQSFTQTSTGATTNVEVNAYCKMRNIVYLMTCKQCKKIGETKLQLNERINLHRSDVNTRKLETALNTDTQADTLFRYTTLLHRP